MEAAPASDGIVAGTEKVFHITFREKKSREAGFCPAHGAIRAEPVRHACVQSENKIREEQKQCLTSAECGDIILTQYIAGWSSSVARRAHNPKVVGSNPAPATISARHYGEHSGVRTALGQPPCSGGCPLFFKLSLCVLTGTTHMTAPKVCYCKHPQ